MISHIQSAQRTIRLEAEAVSALQAKLGDDFSRACEVVLACTGRVVVTGIGKSGHIANKIAATLASTGSPAFFLHAAEASHGDLGMLTENDVVIGVSGSGTTAELVSLLPAIKRIGAPLVAITGNLSSPLAKEASAVLDAGVATEACPLDLAPTSSTTVTLVLGDALAIALLEARGFTADDFAFSHPGGTLGKRLLLKVEDAMLVDFPKVSPDILIEQALQEISDKGIGMTTVLAGDGQLVGVFTDGDLRRCMKEHDKPGSIRIDQAMSTGCKTIPQQALAAEALKIMEDNSITSLVVTDENAKISGVIHLHQLIRAGLA